MSTATKIETGPAVASTLAGLREEAALHRRRGRDREATNIESIIQDIEAAILCDNERAGTIVEVARKIGYDPSHLHAAVRDGLLEDVSPEGEPRQVRYRDALALRRRVPAGVHPTPVRRGEGPKRGPKVKMRIIE